VPVDNVRSVPTPRVVHVAQPTDGGVAAYVARLAGDQARRGVEVAVACPSGEPLGGELDRRGIPRLAWSAGRGPSRRLAGEVAALSAVLRERVPDLVHLHSSTAGLAGRLALRGRTATLFQPHGWSWLAVGGALAPATRGWERWAGRWADRVVCVSEAERELAERAGVRSRFAVVRNGVDLARFPPATAEERLAARAALGLSAGPLAVCVGRIAAQKGQDLLAAAWPRVRQRVPGARLELVGGGEFRAPGEGVRHVGATDDVRSWYAAADVVVFPSRWEGLSLALLEACATGSSIVATDVAGVREILGGSQRGAVVPAGTASLVDAVARRLAEPALVETERAGTAAFAAAHLDEQVTFEQMNALVTTVLDERRGPPPVSRRGRPTSRSEG